MKAIYEQMTDVLYLRAKNAKVGKTIRVNNHTLIDLDKRGGIIGIEVLSASKYVPQELIKSSIKLPNKLKTVIT